MKRLSARFCALACIEAMLIAPTAQGAFFTPTNYLNGADAEVRESSPVSNRGSSNEIASRVRNNFISGSPDDGSDRNSSIYVKIDLTDRQMPSDGHTAFRMTYRNNNMNGSRIQDTITPNPDVRTGMAIYGLNNAALGNWDESTITYLNAPGITFDGDVGTKDFNSDLTFLGVAQFPVIGTQNWLPVGGSLIFESANLDTFVSNAIAGGQGSVTLVATTLHGGDAPFGNWLNFNYLFNPKEQVALNTDPNYDPDATDPNNPTGSPWSGADNSNGDFSPALLLVVPEPSTIALLGIAAVGCVALRRRAA
jgi:hypothetical protein